MRRAGCSRAQVVEHEVAVGDSVDRVLRGPGEAERSRDQRAIRREVHSRQRPSAERQLPRSRQHATEALAIRSEEHTSELQSRGHLVCRLLLEKKKKKKNSIHYRKKKQTN